MKQNSVQPVVKTGAGSLDQLPALLKQYGTKVLLVHGHRPVEDGLLERVRRLLNEAGFPHANLGQILPNPKYGSVKRGIRTARKEKCDVILALGGGSTLQCAKGIALGLGYKGDVWDFWKGSRTPGKVYPVGSILTNPSAGSVVSESCTLVRKGKQKTIRSPKLVSTFAILDPEQAMYPMYPTMCQSFGLFVRLFNGALTADEAARAQVITMIRELLQAQDALSKNIKDVNARGTLFDIGYRSHTEVKITSGILPDLAKKLAFGMSLANGSAQSALFMAWLDTACDKEAVMEVTGQIFDEKPASFEQARTTLLKQLTITGLPMSIPQTGLNINNSQLKGLADTKQEQKILLRSNK